MTDILLIGECSRIQASLGAAAKHIEPCDLDRYLSASSASAFVLGELSEQARDVALKKIRSQASTGFAPIYQTSLAGDAHPLSDGEVSADITLELEIFQKRLLSLPENIWSVRTFRLLAYLWLLPERTLRPSRLPAAPEIYCFDLLSLWDPGGNAVLLNRVLRRGFIEETALIDRIRFCPSCDSGHLNYVDQCPQCTSLDIELEQAIHCFSCGMVANQGQFRCQGRLVCPKCSTALKHIGADYDRPLETMKCNSCRHMFVDPAVRVACLECDAKTDPNDLVVRNFHSYRITAAGEEFLRSGGDTRKSPLVYGAPVDQEHFLWALQWFNNIGSIEAEKGGVVAGLHFANLESLDSHLADTRFLRHAEDLEQQLESLLEATDLLLRYSVDTAFVLFPFQSEKRLTSFLAEVQKIDLSQTATEIELKAMGRTLPDGSLQEDPKFWLRSFAEELAA